MDECCPLTDLHRLEDKDLVQWYDEKLTIVGLIVASLALAALLAVGCYIPCTTPSSARSPYGRVSTLEDRS